MSDLPTLLREARRRERTSQWDLALDLGVSQRHVSFVELGRSVPSRSLLLRWLEALRVPLVVRNDALVAAGFAPAYDDSPWSAQHLGAARAAVAHLLRGHEPWPAMLLDARWDVLAANSGVSWLLDAVGIDVALPDPDGVGAPESPNLLALALGPLGAAIVNLPEAASALLAQLRDEAVSEPSLRPYVEAVEALAPAGPAGVRYPATVVTRYATRLGELSFLSMLTTFGTPHSVTLASLRIELLFPADETTRAVVSGDTGGIRDR